MWSRTATDHNPRYQIPRAISVFTAISHLHKTFTEKGLYDGLSCVAPAALAVVTKKPVLQFLLASHHQKQQHWLKC